MIGRMGGPRFRFNKKTRKRMRRLGKRASSDADKLEIESVDKLNFAPLMRREADRYLTLAKLRKEKKKSKNPR
jgi:hypothetical protein